MKELIYTVTIVCDDDVDEDTITNSLRYMMNDMPDLVEDTPDEIQRIDVEQVQ